MFWTLDRNGTRYIVKPHNGGAGGGMRYLYWAGPEREFDERKPLALSFIKPSQPGATNFEVDDDTLSVTSPFAPVNGKRNRPTDHSESTDSSDTTDSELTSAFQSARAKKRKTEISPHEMDRLYGVSPPAPGGRAQPRDYQLEPMQPTTSTQSVKDREEKKSQRAIAQIESRLDRTLDQIFTPWAGVDQDVSRTTLQTICQVINLMKDNSPQKISRTLNKVLNGGDGKRQSAGGRRPVRSAFLELIASLRSTQAATVDDTGLETPPSLSGSHHQRLASRSLQGPDGGSVRSIRPDAGSILSNRNNHQHDRDFDLGIPPLMVLPPQKQTRTTLIVRVSPSREYVPLKLSECMTSQAFYTKVHGAWGIAREKVAKVTVTFTWMDPSDIMRTMGMNSHVEGCFAHLIEQVDEAPTWAEAPEGRGKCLLDVSITLRE